MPDILSVSLQDILHSRKPELREQVRSDCIGEVRKVAKDLPDLGRVKSFLIEK